MKFNHFKLRYDDKFIYLDRRHTDQGYNPINTLRYDFTDPLVGNAWRSWWENPTFSDHINVPRDIIEQFLHIYDCKNSIDKKGIMSVSVDLKKNFVLLHIDRNDGFDFPVRYSVQNVEEYVNF